MDPFGLLLTTVRDGPAIAAIIATRIAGEQGVHAAPCIVMGDLPGNFSPGGPGNSRTGLQELHYSFKCYGGDEKSGNAGAVLARQLAGEVVDLLHNHGPIKDGQGRLVFQVQIVSISGALSDPGTRWPYYEVLAQTVAAAQAVPV